LVKDYLLHLESKGIKTKVLFWVNDSEELFEDEFFLQRHILLDYEGIVYKTIGDLQNSDKEKFTIAYDKDGFGGTIPESALNDLHPSKLCHEIIANGIIKSISEDGK
jgi:hypothetical protein